MWGDALPVRPAAVAFLQGHEWNVCVCTTSELMMLLMLKLHGAEAAGVLLWWYGSSGWRGVPLHVQG
jgi:hypothetical protein